MARMNESTLFKKVTFEFHDGGILECDVRLIESMEFSQFMDEMARLEITFIVPSAQWAGHFASEQLPAPVDPALPPYPASDKWLLEDGGSDDPNR